MLSGVRMQAMRVSRVEGELTWASSPCLGLTPPRSRQFCGRRCEGRMATRGRVGRRGGAVMVQVQEEEMGGRMAEDGKSSTGTSPERERPGRTKGFMRIGRTIPLVVLNAVTVLWGSQHAVMKAAVSVDGGSPDQVNLVRFFLAALILTPFLNGSEGKRGAKGGGNAVEKSLELPALLAGGELGLWMFGGYALQSLGLLTTSAGKSAFLIYLNVKLVPILAAMFYNRKVEMLTWVSAAIAVCGTTLLCFGAGQAPSTGDLFCIAAAACSAMYILRLETAAKKFSAPALSVSSLWTTVALCLGWFVATERPESVQELLPSAAQMPSILYLGVVTTAFTTMLQTFGQRFIRAEKAALIYAMDPVYAAVFSYFFMGEVLGPQGLAGAGLITLAAVINQSEVVNFMRRGVSMLGARYDELTN